MGRWDYGHPGHVSPARAGMDLLPSLAQTVRAFKAKVALEALREHESVAEIVRKVSPARAGMDPLASEEEHAMGMFPPHARGWTRSAP